MTIRNLQNVILSLTATIFLALVFFKAYHASFTHDESLTYNIYVGKTYWEIISMVDPSANNHILNTLLMKVSEYLFGNREWALRLPNVLGFLVFSIYTIRIFISSKRSWVGLLVISTLFFQPFLNEMFAVGRGYGISYAMILAGVFHLNTYLDQSDKYGQTKALIFFLLATLASLNLIYLFVSVIMYINVLAFLSAKNGMSYFKTLLKINKNTFWVSTLLLIVLYEPFRLLIAEGQLYFGGSEGFLTDTISSIAHVMLYEHYYFSHVIEFVYVMLGLGLGFIIWALFTLKKTRDFKEMVRTPLFSVAFIFMAIVAGSIANNWLFDTLFMLRRTAFFLYVLFIIMLFFAVDELSSNTHLKSRLILYSLLVFSLSAAHFVLCYDSSKYLEWGGDASIKPMLTELEHQAKSEGSTVKINLGVSWFFEPSINYYRKAYGYHTWLNKVTRDPFNANQEYFFVIEEHKKDLPETETTLIQSYPKANTLLLKNTRN